MQNQTKGVPYAYSVYKYMQATDPLIAAALREVVQIHSSVIYTRILNGLLRAVKEKTEDDFFVKPSYQIEVDDEPSIVSDDDYIHTTIQLVKEMNYFCVISAILTVEKIDKSIITKEALLILSEQLKSIYTESKCNQKTIELFSSIATGSILNYTSICFNYDVYEKALEELDKYLSLTQQLPTSINPDDQGVLKKQLQLIEIAYSSYFEILKNESNISDQLQEFTNTVLSMIGIKPTLDKSLIATVGNSEFHIIRQGIATNQLNRLMDKPLKSDDELTINGTRRIASDNFTMYYANHEEIGAVKPSAKLLLDSLIITATNINLKDNKVFLSLKDYAAMRGKKPSKDFRKQVVQDLISLANIKIEYTEIINKKPEKSGIIALFGGTARIKNGVIEFNFNFDFLETLKKYPIMNYPAELLTFNLNANPHSHNLLRRISEHKNMNHNKSNRDIIGVKTLIDSCPTLPNIADLKKHEMQVSKRIINPFERDMDAIQCLTWEYCGKNGTSLNERPKNYLEFINSNIKVTWNNYPLRKVK